MATKNSKSTKATESKLKTDVGTMQKWFDVVIEYAGKPDENFNKEIQKAARGLYLRWGGVGQDRDKTHVETRYSARQASLAEKAAEVFQKTVKKLGKKAEVFVFERDLARLD